MKGQAGIEGMIIFAIIGVVLVFVIVTFGLRTVEIDNLKINLEADKNCNLIKNSINQVMLNGEGAKNEVKIPDTLLSIGYNMSFVDSEKKIIILWNNNIVTCSTLTPNVTNSTHSTFYFEKGDNTVENIGGLVYVTKS